MIIAIQHCRHPAYGPITELHCPTRHVPVVGEAIRLLTGEHPVPVPLCGCTAVYFVRALAMEHACALLRLIILDDYAASEIDWTLIGAEVVLEEQGRKRFGPETLTNAPFNEEPCLDCCLLRFKGDQT